MHSLLRSGAAVLIAGSLILPAFAQDSSSSSSEISPSSSSVSSQASSSSMSSSEASKGKGRSVRALLDQAKQTVKAARKQQQADRKEVRKTTIACGVDVLQKREAALLAAWTKFSGATTTAYQTRSTALTAAWAKTGADRKTDIDAAWRAFQVTQKMNAGVFKVEQKAAWDAFKAACKNEASEPSSTEVQIAE